MAHFPEDLHQHYHDLAALLHVRPEDIEEFHTHGHGHGGQKINKSNNCVELTHHPSGITVRFQHHRGLHQNRREAFELLLKKIEEHYTTLAQEKAHLLHREAAEHHVRSTGAQERVLEEKHHQGEKKEWRGMQPSAEIVAPDEDQETSV